MSRVKTITWLSPGDAEDWFPDIEQALDEPAGLLAAGGALSPRRLLAAYRRGIFPWYSPNQPVLWWCPDPREVLFPGEFRISRSLNKSIKNRGFKTSIDSDFESVVSACAEPRAAALGTWITAEMAAAYCALHELGHAHSIEVRREAALVGGLYGVRLGGIFFGESMFSRERDASKVALAWLVDYASREGIAIIDCQLPSAHLRSLGSRPVPRCEFAALVAEHVNER